MHLERYGNSLPTPTPPELEPIPDPGCWSNLVTVSTFETTRTVTGAQVTPRSLSSMRSACPNAHTRTHERT
jgi:hypothetical protein